MTHGAAMEKRDGTAGKKRSHYETVATKIRYCHISTGHNEGIIRYWWHKRHSDGQIWYYDDILGFSEENSGCWENETENNESTDEQSDST